MVGLVTEADLLFSYIYLPLFAWLVYFAVLFINKSKYRQTRCDIRYLKCITVIISASSVFYGFTSDVCNSVMAGTKIVMIVSFLLIFRWAVWSENASKTIYKYQLLCELDKETKKQLKELRFQVQCLASNNVTCPSCGAANISGSYTCWCCNEQSIKDGE